jgi:effector-binding domain-containing protein
VTVVDAAARPTAVVAAATTWQEFPSLWAKLLDEMRACLVASALPAGQVAMTVHRGAYAGLDGAHRAVLDWCAARGLRPAGQRWEVYGPRRENPAEVWTEVYWLLA